MGDVPQMTEMGNWILECCNSNGYVPFGVTRMFGGIFNDGCDLFNAFVHIEEIKNVLTVHPASLEPQVLLLNRPVNELTFANNAHCLLDHYFFYQKMFYFFHQNNHNKT